MQTSDVEAIYGMLAGKITPELLEQAYSMGMLRKEHLVDGESYWGTCRNAERAVWHADKNRFTYVRNKFGNLFDEDIVHPADDEGFDIFVTTRREGKE